MYVGTPARLLSCAAVAALLAGCALPAAPAAAPPPPVVAPSAAAPAAPAPAPAAPAAAAALRLLGTLAVKGRAPRTGYTRAQFGHGWGDPDHNGCSTRDDVLARDLREVQRRGRCVVVAGVLDDPYTGRQVDFAKARAAEVQVDHVVSLSNAWQTGAAGWPPYRRVLFANDPRELRATTAAANTAKSDGDAATWLPPAKGYRCAFVAVQVQVKAAYRLWVTPAERDAMTRVLQRCA